MRWQPSRFSGRSPLSARLASPARLLATSALLLSCVLALRARAADSAPAYAEHATRDSARALALGERIYRDGMLPSGEPVQAVVQGDIPVAGTMFSCANCHLRSGVGATEGTVLTLPTNGAKLFKPLKLGVEFEARRRERLPRWFESGFSRPAYTDETLARALRGGIDPAGRELSGTMPRYLLRDDEMALLVNYLRNLSAETAPGVTDTTISFATVVADDAPEADRRTMLEALRAYVESHNVQTRQPLKRAGIDLAETMDRAYRLMDLAVWELHGDRSTWEEQLLAHYRAKPVFALIAGISGGDWAPIHAFCERERLPCLLPLTDYPVISSTDWYTLYFSRGFFQEGLAAVHYLRRDARGALPPLVVVRRDAPDGARLLAGVVEAATAVGTVPTETVVPAGRALDVPFWRSLGEQHPGAAFFLWLRSADLVETRALAAAAGPSSLIFLSGELLRQDAASIPETIRPQVRLTWPRRLPNDGSRSAFVSAAWAKLRGLAPGDPAIHAKVYFLGWLLTDAFMMMGLDYYRDYFLDVIGMETDQTYASAMHPRLSFGAGQRYASKGCFIVGVGAGSNPPLTPLSPWVIQ